MQESILLLLKNKISLTEQKSRVIIIETPDTQTVENKDKEKKKQWIDILKVIFLERRLDYHH